MEDIILPPEQYEAFMRAERGEADPEAKAKREKEKWGFISSLNSYTAQSPEFILPDFMPIAKRKVTMLSAPGGAGKSFIAIQAGLRIAYQGGKVGLWLTEDESGEIRERAELIRERILFNKEPIPDTLYVRGSEAPSPVITPEEVEIIKREWAGLDLVVIDPLIGFFEGNENDNSLAKRFMQVLTAVAVANDMSILVIHHNTKANADGETTTRGASAFVDAVRILYTLHYDKEEQEHRLKLEKDNVNAKKFKGDLFKVKAIPFDIVIEESRPQQTTFGGIDDDF